ncbi:MAG: Por secretion system C-terminal sorting protein, partial [Bacteroidetes bacterium]|nr:Por secretion system C-terminal sorting protein [Bacteroidota bacterium]
MTQRSLIALAFALLVTSSFEAVSQSSKREFRGAWIASVVNLDWPSSDARGRTGVQQAELVALLDQLKSTGITAVLLQVRSECDAVYPSSLEPWSYWLTGEQGVAPSPYYDPLEFAIAAAHARGLELHAWLNPYRAERAIGSYTLSSSHVVKSQPGWILTFPAVGLNLLDPGSPGARAHIAGVVADVVRRYDVDGVHFDDYFYPYPVSSAGFPGITTEDAASFAADPRGFASIAAWRRDNVNLLVRMVDDSIKALKPYVRFGLSPFGIWRNGVPPGIVGMDAYSAIYCDAPAWLRQGTVDYLTPQLYWPIGGGQDYASLVSWWAD